MQILARLKVIESMICTWIREITLQQSAEAVGWLQLLRRTTLDESYETMIH